MSMGSAKNNEKPSESESAAEDKLEQLRRLLGVREDKPRIVGPIGAGKTRQELYEEEMRMLQEGGSDQSGQDAMRKAMRRIGRIGRIGR